MNVQFSLPTGKNLSLAGNFLTLLFLVSAPVFAQFHHGHQSAPDRRPTITVSGDALVQVRPDQVILSLGVETVDDEVQESIQNVVSSIPSDPGSMGEGIAPGQISIQGRVQVTFLLEEKVESTD